MSAHVIPDEAHRYVAHLLEERTGQKLAASRVWRIDATLKPLLRDRGLASVIELVGALIDGRDATLPDLVVDALLNNETSFFRDAAVFQLLESGALESLRMARSTSRKLRIWCAGCSTGQEVWTLAIILADQPARWQGWSIEILGTDVSASAVERARAGIYSQFEIQRGLPVTKMIRWFDQVGRDWRVKAELAARVRFRQANLLSELAPTEPFDLILCRNVLLYFAPEQRRQAFARLAQASAPDAFLMLGAGETVVGQTDAFQSDRVNRGLYRVTPPGALTRGKAA